MNYTFSVHKYIYSILGNTEEVGGLDNLEALVHQGGAVYGYLATHTPGGVSESVGKGNLAKLVCALAIEGAT